MGRPRGFCRQSAAGPADRDRARTAASGQVIPAAPPRGWVRRAVPPGDRADPGDLGAPFRGLAGPLARATGRGPRVRQLGGGAGRRVRADVRADRIIEWPGSIAAAGPRRVSLPGTRNWSAVHRAGSLRRARPRGHVGRDTSSANPVRVGDIRHVRAAVRHEGTARAGGVGTAGEAVRLSCCPCLLGHRGPRGGVRTQRADRWHARLSRHGRRPRGTRGSAAVRTVAGPQRVPADGAVVR